MLINALCDYYEILRQKGAILPDGYSRVDISYLICLTDAGGIADKRNRWQYSPAASILTYWHPTSDALHE